MSKKNLTKILDINSNYLGISRNLLMENAGQEIAREAEKFEKIAVFCGLGNNGGDGFVAARHLASSGKKVKVFSLKGKRAPEAQENFNILKNLPSIEILEIKDSSEADKVREELKEFDAIVDALIGVGIKGELREPLKSLVEVINSSPQFKLSVDSPTPGIKADLVVSFHFPKTENAKVVLIGIPKEAESFVGPGDVWNTLPKRTGEEHKGDFGRVLVLGGSKNFLGAPYLVAEAALRTGADLAIIACPKYVAQHLPFNPNLIINPLPSENYFSLGDLEQLQEINFDVVVIGNGLGIENETKLALKKFLRENEKPVILDADALKLISPRNLNENMIITPHAAEFKSLFEEYPEDFQEKITLVQTKAKKYSTTVVLKNPVDIISNDRETKLNKVGNPGMTVGGTGDVLAGVIGALAVQASPMDAASAGTFLTGLAGDIAQKKLGYYFTATDVIERIPEAIKFCQQYW